MKDPVRLKELILETVDMAKVMLDYGVKFVYDPTLSEEAQYHCPFHGKDNKPSSRLYKATKSSYCWVCKKRWNVISFVMDKESMSFSRALTYIVRKYGIDVSSIPDEPDIRMTTHSMDWTEKEMLGTKKSIMKHRGKIPLEKYSRLCVAWYMISYSISRGLDVTESITRLKNKIESLT